jgi:hypothetical protein
MNDCTFEGDEGNARRRRQAPGADLIDLLSLRAGQSANLSTCTDAPASLTFLIEEVSEIAGPVIQWSAKRRQKHPAMKSS